MRQRKTGVPLTPRDWQIEATVYAAKHLGEPEGERALVEARRYGALADELARLDAERHQAQLVCSEAYQVVGSMLSDLDQFDSERGQKLLDNLAAQQLVHKDVLPWPSFRARTP